MALGDFGGGLVAGMQGAQAFAQQRRDNQFRRDQLQLDRDRLSQAAQEHEDRVAQWKKEHEIAKRTAAVNERNAAVAEGNLAVNQGNLAVNQGNLAVNQGRLKIEQNADARLQTEFDQGQAALEAQDVFAMGQAQGFYKPGESQNLDENLLSSALQSGTNRQNDLFALGVLNNTPRPEGFVFTEIDRTTAPGRAIVRGRYEDGTPGVMTAEGGVQKGEQVVVLDFDQAARLISNEFPTVGIKAYGGAGYSEILSKEGLNAITIRERTQSAEQDTAVINAVDSSGDIGFARAFRGALTSAGSEDERRGMLADMAETMGIQYNPPAATPSSELVDYSPPSREEFGGTTLPNELGFDSRARARIKRLDAKIARAESDAEGLEGRAMERQQERLTNLEAERDEIVRATNQQALDSVELEISDLEKKRDKARGPRKEYWQGKIDEKVAKREEIQVALGVVTPAMQTATYKQLETDIFDRINGMNKNEIDQLVDSGQLPFSPEQVAVMRQRAQEAGVSNASDLSKLPSKERAGYYALLSTIAQDPSQREAFRNENANLLETGTTSMSARDRDISDRDRAKIANTTYSNVTARLQEIRMSKAQGTDSMRAAGGVASKILMEGRTTFFDEEGNFKATLESARTFAQKLPELQAEAAEFSPGSEEFDLIDDAVSATVSNVVAAYVNDGDANLVDGVISFFFRDDPNGQMSDFSLSRVIVDDPENPTKLIYLGPGGRVVQGAEMPLSGLQEIDNNVYNVVVKRAVQNSRNRGN